MSTRKRGILLSPPMTAVPGRTKFLLRRKSFWLCLLVLVVAVVSSEDGTCSGHLEEEEDPERNIFFIHVGKTGGTTYRRLMLPHCSEQHRLHRQKHPSPRNQELQERCDAHARDFPNKLSVQTTKVLHHASAGGLSDQTLQQVTTFVVSLRNPVERIVSAYRYSHPASCDQPDNPSKSMHHGCYLLSEEDVYLTAPHVGNLIYNECFPSSDIEEFAQSLLPPYPTNSPAKCQELARTMVTGYTTQKNTEHRYDNNDLVDVNPHMHYNYRFYASRTVDRFPQTELFAVRTEHEWDDLVAIDQRIGGRGKFRSQGEAFTHRKRGQQSAATISASASSKLCCLLAEELEVYWDLLERAQNLARADHSQQLLRQ